MIFGVMHHLFLDPVRGSRAVPDEVQRSAVLSRVDRAILDAALGDWRGGTWPEALARLLAATERSIPAGRIYVLGRSEHGLVVGSLVSGVGITEEPDAIAIVRVPSGSSPETRHATLSVIARLAQ